nr:hypothetical protein CFP56_57565 [Quercus suber]
MDYVRAGNGYGLGRHRSSTSGSVNRNGSFSVSTVRVNGRDQSKSCSLVHVVRSRQAILSSSSWNSGKGQMNPSAIGPSRPEPIPSSILGHVE